MWDIRLLVIRLQGTRPDAGGQPDGSVEPGPGPAEVSFWHYLQHGNMNTWEFFMHPLKQAFHNHRQAERGEKEEGRKRGERRGGEESREKGRLLMR